MFEEEKITTEEKIVEILKQNRNLCKIANPCLFCARRNTENCEPHVLAKKILEVVEK